MWEIYEHRRLAKVLPRLQEIILKRYEKWKDVVRISGPLGLREILGFHDKALRGEWAGHRASRLGHQYRVIYQIDGQDVLVYVMDLTAHDYRRK